MKHLLSFLIVTVSMAFCSPVVQVQNGQAELFQAVVSQPLSAAQVADFAGGRLVELGSSGEVIASVPVVIDASSGKPELVCMLPGITPPGALRTLALIDGKREDGMGQSDLEIENDGEFITVRNSYFELQHPVKGRGGLPRNITFQLSGRTDDKLYLLDRLYRRDTRKQAMAGDDDSATAKVVFSSPLRVVVEARMRYGRSSESVQGNPRAVYRFVYSPYSPAVDVSARFEKDDDTVWNELHFLHLTRNDFHYTNFTTGEPAKVMPMQAPGVKGVSHSARFWGLMATDSDAAGVGKGGVTCWDASDEFYYYACLKRIVWKDRVVTRTGALYFGPALDPSEYSRWLSPTPTLQVSLLEGGVTAESAGQDKAPPEGAHELTNDALRLVFADKKNGFDCVGIENRLAGNTRFVRAREDAPGLWKIEFRTPYKAIPEGEEGDSHEIVILDNHAECERTVSKRAGALTLLWRDLDLGDEQDVVDVTARIRLPAGASASEWRIDVINRSKRFGVYETNFPYLPSVNRRCLGTTLVPGGNWGGRLLDSKGRWNLSYPSTQCPVQFMGFMHNGAGLYLASHDPGARTKQLRITGEQDATFSVLAENATMPGNSQKSEIPFVVAAYTGDWWGAARIYRAWATKQEWCKKGWIRDRKDIPQRLKDLGFWWIESGTPDRIGPLLLEAEKRCTGLTMGLHWYSWHKIPFDHTYPEYFPTKPRFDKVTRQLTARNQLIMPYINGRLWDAEIESFKTAGYAGSCKQPSGENYIETYGSGRKLSPMCPTTQVWQDKVGEICHRLMDECGVNGIYLDQIGAARPKPCYDPSHGHPLGGGRHWVDAYRKMLDPIKAEAIKMDCALTTENTAEPYMDNIDAYLTWIPRHDTDVPLLPAVYSGYTIYFTSPQAPQDDLDAYAQAQGRDFLWGCQLGWNGTWMLQEQHREKLDFMLKASRLRVAAKKFMLFGELLGDIRPTELVPPLTTTWNRRKPHPATLPSVMGTIWRSLDGELALAMVNTCAEPRTFVYTVKPGELLAESAANWQIERLTENGSMPMAFVSSDAIHRREELAPREIRVLTIRPVANASAFSALAVAVKRAKASSDDPVLKRMASEYLFHRALVGRGILIETPSVSQRVVRGEPLDLTFQVVTTESSAELEVDCRGSKTRVTVPSGSTQSVVRQLWLEEDGDGVAEITATVCLPAAGVERECPVKIRFVPTVSVQVSAPLGVHGGESFLLPVVVRNNSRAVRKGRVVLRVPDTWSVRPAAEFAVPSMAPGATRSYLLTCRTPRTKADNQVTLSAFFAENSTPVSLLLRKSRPIAKAAKIAKPPVIDGRLDDWTSEVQVRLGGAAGGVQIKKDYGDEADCAATYRMAWDRDFLYLAIEVTDNAFFQDQEGFTIWQGDCIQLAFRAGAPNPKQGYDGSEFEVGLTKSPNGPVMFQWAPGAAAVKDGKFAVVRGPSATVYEAAIPWSALGVKAPSSGKRVAWSTTVNDNDGEGFRGWLEWTPGVCGGKDSSAFGWLELE